MTKVIHLIGEEVPHIACGDKNPLARRTVFTGKTTCEKCRLTDFFKDLVRIDII